MITTTFPFYLQLGEAKILLHGIFEFIGVFVAFRYYLLLRRKQGDFIKAKNAFTSSSAQLWER